MTAMMRARAADTVQKIDRLVAAGYAVTIRRVAQTGVTAVHVLGAGWNRWYDGGTLEGALAQLTDAELAKHERGAR